jgi:transcriptional regulator with XRE-family HTH domain
MSKRRKISKISGPARRSVYAWRATTVEELALMIQKVRGEKRLSQEDLARLAGLSLRTIAKIEAGESKDPPFTTIVRLHRALDLPYSHFEKAFEKILASPKKRKPRKESGK